MKQLAILIGACLIFGSTFANPMDLKELELEEVFIIENGFDSNDDIEVTVHGQLPSACYKVHETKLTKTNSNHYEVKTYIKRKNLSGCSEDLISSPVNFTPVLSLGELASGRYIFSYHANNKEIRKVMNIRPAISTSIDDSFYAPISNAFIPELIFTTSSAQIVMTGIFHNSCFKLKSDDISIIKENNIFIIIPKTRFIDLGQCKTKRFPIRQIIDLGPIKKEGHYMIHIRSLSGLSVNKVFHVEKAQFTNRSSF